MRGPAAFGARGGALRRCAVPCSRARVQVDTEQNVVLISIASVADPGLAPEGKHSLHAYYPATEPYGLWAGLDRKSDEYAALKKERSQVRVCSLCLHVLCGHVLAVCVPPADRATEAHRDM